MALALIWAAAPAGWHAASRQERRMKAVNLFALPVKLAMTANILIGIRCFAVTSAAGVPIHDRPSMRTRTLHDD